MMLNQMNGGIIMVVNQLIGLSVMLVILLTLLVMPQD